MTSARVNEERLRGLLCELENAGELRHQAAETVIEAAIWGGELPSPFISERSLYETVVIPLCIRLGIAVRIAEIEEGLGPRSELHGFKYETAIAFEYWRSNGILPDSDPPSEIIWYEQVIPSAVWFGYEATTA